MLTTTRHTARFRAVLALTSAVLGAALIGPPLAAAAPTTAPALSQQGIIMRDGGICDPIRHMGC
jgi:hypothetical protein